MKNRKVWTVILTIAIILTVGLTTTSCTNSDADSDNAEGIYIFWDEQKVEIDNESETNHFIQLQITVTGQERKRGLETWETDLKYIIVKEKTMIFLSSETIDMEDLFESMKNAIYNEVRVNDEVEEIRFCITDVEVIAVSNATFYDVARAKS